MRSEPALQQALIAGLGVGGRWFAGELPGVLDTFRPLRNEGSHQTVVPREKAIYWRDLLLGVGTDGYFVRLSRCKPPSGSNVPA